MFPRFIAIGDVHGELQKFLEILACEGLIDPEGHWSGADTVLLQIGDLIDRGPKSLEAVDFIRRLQEEAASSGGRLVRLLGNHELLVIQGIYHYCNFRDPAALGRALREEVLSGKIQAAFVWQGRLYIHAGLRQLILDHLGKELKIDVDAWDPSRYGELAAHIDRTLVRSVQQKNYEHPIFWADATRGGEDLVGGLFWSDFRDLAREGMNPIRQVVGHTPAFKRDARIYWTPDKKKINIDAGMYEGYGGNRAWLVAEGGHLYSKQLLKGKVVTETIE